MSREDENIEYKINCYNLSNTDAPDGINNYDIISAPIDLFNIKLRLIQSNVILNKLSIHQNEYNYIRQLNKEYGIFAIKEYINMKNTHHAYIDDPYSYFSRYGVWNCWYDFLGMSIDNKFLSNKKDWFIFCKDKNLLSIRDYELACILYPELPTEPGLLYNDFSTIQQELSFTKRR